MASDKRAGLLGYGIAGRVFHAPLITATPGLTLAAIVTRSPARRQQAAADNPGVSVLADAAELLRTPLDLIVVATPNRTSVRMSSIRPSSFSARWRRCTRELDLRRPGVQVDDDAFVALRHANGVRSHLWMSAVAADHGPRFRVLGSKAAFTIHGVDGQEDALAAGRRPGDPGWGEEPHSAWGQAGLLDDVHPVPSLPGAYQAFYEAIRDGETPVEPESAEYALRVIEAAFRSARTGKVETP